MNVARLKETLQHPDEEVISAYLDAANVCRTRAEALHGAARFCRNHERHLRGYLIAAEAIEIAPPRDALFSEDWIYEYGLLDEYAVNAYWAGKFKKCVDACQTLLVKPEVPAVDKDRIGKNLAFAQAKLDDEAARPASAKSEPTLWAPDRPLAGTELMVEGLRMRLPYEIDRIDLRVNLYDPAQRDARALVLWFHHDVDQAAVQWCHDKALTAAVARFVFISYWQRERYLATFGLAPERCIVIKYAVDQTADLRRWEPAPVFRCAYTSTPFRGLDVLLDAWDLLPARNAELHVWSSMKLYQADDKPYRHVIDRARETIGVVYHGLAPNEELCAALRTMHFFTYPNMFAETACRSVIEAMAAGCRVIVPSLGALPEMTAGYARVYPWCSDPREHAEMFAQVLTSEMTNPWRGRSNLAIAQQSHCASVFTWSRCLEEWRALIDNEIMQEQPAKSSRISQD